ncbi:MAG TPA: serine hydrolase domain-containing protein [Phycisphaerales bacterium]|nr:serine hydrolase domain-containing protein [Phycisphaerales bacterium]
MRVCVVGVAAVLAAGVPGYAQVRAPAADGKAAQVALEAPVDVSEVLEPLRETGELPALAVVVTRGREVLAQGVTGVRKAGDETKATMDDRWHLGSCTKSMTATLCAVLVEEGKLRWDSTLGEVFPDVEKHERWKSVTLEQLLAHRAGVVANLPRPGEWLAAEGVRAQRQTAVREVLAKEPLHEPGTKYLYSNAGYVLAGAMAEKVCDEAWEDLMRERVFEPLGVRTAGFGPPGRKREVDQPWGHRRDGSPTRTDNPAAMGPAGTVHASLADWGRYIAQHTGGHRADRPAGTWLLKPETFARIHRAYEGPGNDYGFGWGIVRRPWGKGPGGDGTVLTHAGSNTMWFCVVWAAPELDMAVLVATNVAGDSASKACDQAAGAMIKRFMKPAEAEPSQPEAKGER